MQAYVEDEKNCYTIAFIKKTVTTVKPEQEFMHTDGNTYKIDAAGRLYRKKTVWHDRGGRSTFWVSVEQEQSDNPYGEGDGGL